MSQTINNKGGDKMLILGAVVILLGSYLVYALVNPEKF
ncbi:MAG: K(+)-transporting ATPase subunit F [Clostridiales bacterium]|nr:K(+)-transporting ATPase subunit F [Clostridiales bacterium]PWM06019.1 MAG: K(+)-transporting ATPase subunit F [Clostridiales bacterium]